MRFTYCFPIAPDTATLITVNDKSNESVDSYMSFFLANDAKLLKK